MVTKDVALSYINLVLTELYAYRNELKQKQIDLHKSANNVYGTVFNALRNIIGDIDFAVQEVAGERILFSNWSKQAVAKPVIKYGSSIGVQQIGYSSTNGGYFGKTIRNKEVIMPDIFEYDVGKLDEIVKAGTFNAILSNIYLKAPVDDPGVETFKDARYKYFFFETLDTVTTITDEDYIITCDYDTYQAEHFWVVTIIEGGTAKLYAIKRMRAPYTASMWSRQNPEAYLTIFEGDIDIGTSPQLDDPEDKTFHGLLVEVSFFEPGYEAYFGDYKLPSEMAFLVRKKQRGMEVLFIDWVDRNTFIDSSARSAYLRRRVWEMGRSVPSFVPSTDVRIYDAYEWMTQLQF